MVKNSKARYTVFRMTRIRETTDEDLKAFAAEVGTQPASLIRSFIELGLKSEAIKSLIKEREGAE